MQPVCAKSLQCYKSIDLYVYMNYNGCTCETDRVKRYIRQTCRLNVYDFTALTFFEGDDSMTLKVSTVFDKFFHVLFAAVFAYLTVMVICSVCSFSVSGAFLAIGVLILSVLVIYILYQKCSDISNKRLYIVFTVLIVAMLAIQVVMSFLLKTAPSMLDCRIINEIAMSYAKNGNMEGINEIATFPNYLVRYPNNNGIAILLSFYYRIVYLMLGYVPRMAPVLLNAVFINAAIILLFFTAKKMFNNFFALVTMIFAFLFIPYYTYCPYFYTDTFSLPFTILPILLFVTACESRGTVRKIIAFLFAGISCAIGYELKGSVAVIVVALIIYVVLNGKLKNFLIGTGSVLMGFLAVIIAFSGLVSSLNIATEEQLYEIKYPMTHWIMMGLKDDGKYDSEDSVFTAHSGNYDEKKAANIKVIKERLSDYGFGGLMEHFDKKLEQTWNDGTYAIANYINEPYNRNTLHEFILNDGKHRDVFVAVCSGLHICTLAMISISAIFCLIKRNINMTLINITIFGIFLFLLLWESKPRYLYNFTPFFLMSAAYGLISIVQKLPKPGYKKYKRLKKE